MNYKDYKLYVREDRRRWNSNKSHINMFLTNSCYRLIIRHRRCELLRSYKVLMLFYQMERFIYHRTCVRCGCDIPSNVKIGPGFRMDHSWGVIINSKAVIGSNFLIKSGAVIGATEKGIPSIGNNVSVGVHALLLGNISVADGAEIGAGAIVTHDVLENAIVICEAAHISRIKR